MINSNPVAATTSHNLPLPSSDQIGVVASILCAIHCGLAPILLLALPAFGELWAHPASHAIAGIFIVPLAVFSIYRGFKRHRLRWIAVLAGLGILLVIIGAALPAMTPGETAACVDKCCPSLQVADTGEMSLHIPPAAIVTTLGGIFLILAHIGNLYACRKCCDLGSCGN